jgi:hypothetical protein
MTSLPFRLSAEIVTPPANCTGLLSNLCGE